jgi:endonuclease III related protein
MRGIKSRAIKPREGDSGLIRKIFRTLEESLGAQHWWPAASAFEVVVGAYLTQNTAWTNVERAIGNLHKARVLSIAGIRETPVEELERLVRPAGYFRQKAARLKRFVEHLDARHRGSLKAMFATPLPELRQELLALNGVGPETADSILLYAAGKEVFVVDAYTRRIWERHRLGRASADYEEIRTGAEMALAEETAVEDAVQSQSQKPHPNQKQVRTGHPEARLGPTTGVAGKSEHYPQITIHPPSAASAMPRSELSRRYNEFHALLVQVGKHHCLKAAPRCELCPLRPLLPPGARPR